LGPMDVTVVGAGIIGLTAAVELQAAGHRVQVVAAATGEDTTSAVAGALWLPFRAHPPGRVNAWAHQTRKRLEALASAAPQAGVDILTVYEAAAGPEAPWWASAAGPLQLVVDSPLGCAAWHFRAPRVVPALFLPWLEAQLQRPILRRRLTSLEEAQGEVVVHCAGLGARALADDGQLQAVYGQVLLVEAGEVDRGVCLGDARDESNMLYSIPRRGDVLLGGCARPCRDEEPLVPDKQLTADILARARAASSTTTAMAAPATRWPTAAPRRWWLCWPPPKPAPRRPLSLLAVAHGHQHEAMGGRGGAGARPVPRRQDFLHPTHRLPATAHLHQGAHQVAHHVLEEGRALHLKLQNVRGHLEGQLAHRPLARRRLTVGGTKGGKVVATK